MLEVLVFCPTNRYGGLDILFSTLERQNYPFMLCMADELAIQRAHVYEEHGMTQNTIFVDTIKQPGDQRALAQAYNNAADLAVSMDFDLLISLQDYIWIPDNGIKMFVEDHQNFENSLITGLVSLSDAFSDQDIADPCGYFSIFREGFEPPKELTWLDPRATMYARAEVDQCAPEHWEANWAAIPVSIFKEGIRWNLDYDQGIAYENIDFAKTAARELGTPCILDKRNHALGIAHRKIWPEEETQLKRFNNRYLYEEKWGVTS